MTLVRVFDAPITALRWVAMLLYCSPKPIELSQFSFDEPLTPRMKTAMRSALSKYYHSSRKSVYGRVTRMHWTSDINESFGMSTLSTPMTPLHCWNLRRFCNKPTALYWAHPAQINDRCPRVLFACAYKEWFRAHDNDPNIEFDHFFANPIRITSSGPGTVAGILEAHRSLCNQAVHLLDMIRQGKADEVHLITWPDPRNYRLLPLYRAIIVVLDELALFNATKPHQPISLDEQVQRQTVLMILTGDQTGLSAPISFESVRSQSLPLLKADTVDNVDIIRVSLRTAVRFIADLQRKEEDAFPDLRQNTTDRSIGPSTKNISFGLVSADEWVDEIMHKAQEEGANNVFEMKWAAEMMKAEQEGNGNLTPELYHFSPMWI